MQRKGTSAVGMATPSLLKRKDFLGIDNEAAQHPNRTYFFRSKGADLDEIIHACTLKLEGTPNHLKALYLRGSSLYKNNAYKDAINDLNCALELEPCHQESLYYRGLSYFKLDLQEQAIADYSAVLQLNPNHVNAAFARAASYNTIGQFSKAIEDYNFALLMDPPQPPATPGRPSSNSSGGTLFKDNNFDKHDRQARERTSSVPSSVGFVEKGSVDKWLDEPDSSSPVKASAGRPTSGTSEKSIYTLDKPSSPTISSRRDSSAGSELPPPPTIRLAQPNRTRTSSNGSVEETISLSVSGVADSSMNKIHHKSAASTASQSTRKSNANIFYNVPEGMDYTTSVTQSTSRHPSNTLSRPDWSLVKRTPARKPPPTPRSPNNIYYDMNDMTTSSTSDAASNDAISTADVHHSKGYEKRQEGDYNSAIIHYSDALVLHPAHFKALFNRGFAKDKLHDFGGAIVDYTSAISVEPDNCFAYYNRGISYDRLGEYNLACADFTKAIELDSRNADFYHNRAFCFRKMGRLEDAVSDYSASLLISPQHYKALYNRAFCREKLGNLAEAAADYTSVLALQPDHTGSLTSRAGVFERLGQMDSAIADLTALIAVHSKYQGSSGDQDSKFAAAVPALTSRGRLHSRKGALDMAIADFSQSLALCIDPATNFARGLCYKNSDRFEKALLDFTASIEGEFQQETAYLHRGYCHRKLERYSECVTDYSSALDLMSLRPEIEANETERYV